MKFKIIHCSVWGDIKVSPLAISIIDTPHFQRLHYIRQTGFAYKVFPGATTSRFAHSIGVYHVVGQWIKCIEQNIHDFDQEKDTHHIPHRTIELLKIAGLVHDIGHGPFSHAFDELLHSIDNRSVFVSHEARSEYIFRDLVNRYSVKLTTDEVDQIIGFIDGKDTGYWWDVLINNTQYGIDADKIDYLIRDSKNLGLLNHFDANRIMSRSTVRKGQLSFPYRIKDDIDTLFRMRHIMHKNIYRHHRIQKFQSEWLYAMVNNPEVVSLLKTNICDALRADKFILWTDDMFLFTYMDTFHRQLFETRDVAAQPVSTPDVIPSEPFVDKQLVLQNRVPYF